MSSPPATSEPTPQLHGGDTLLMSQRLDAPFDEIAAASASASISTSASTSTFASTAISSATSPVSTAATSVASSAATTPRSATSPRCVRTARSSRLRRRLSASLFDHKPATPSVPILPSPADGGSDAEGSDCSDCTACSAIASCGFSPSSPAPRAYSDSEDDISPLSPVALRNRLAEAVRRNAELAEAERKAEEQVLLAEGEAEWGWGPEWNVQRYSIGSVYSTESGPDAFASGPDNTRDNDKRARLDTGDAHEADDYKTEGERCDSANVAHIRNDEVVAVPDLFDEPEVIDGTQTIDMANSLGLTLNRDTPATTGDSTSAPLPRTATVTPTTLQGNIHAVAAPHACHGSTGTSASTSACPTPPFTHQAPPGAPSVDVLEFGATADILYGAPNGGFKPAPPIPENDIVACPGTEAAYGHIKRALSVRAPRGTEPAAQPQTGRRAIDTTTIANALAMERGMRVGGEGRRRSRTDGAGGVGGSLRRMSGTIRNAVRKATA